MQNRYIYIQNLPPKKTFLCQNVTFSVGDTAGSEVDLSIAGVFHLLPLMAQEYMQAGNVQTDGQSRVGV